MFIRALGLMKSSELNDKAGDIVVALDVEENLRRHEGDLHENI